MKPSLQKRSVFIAKSMLWSILFYIVLMLAFNWEDVSSRITGKSAVTTITSPLPSSPDAEPCGPANAPVKISGAALFSDAYSLAHILGKI